MIGDKDRYALITGASSGIGYELAKLLAKDSKNLVIVARSLDKLTELTKEVEGKYGISVMILTKDLSDTKSPQEIYSELENEGINVDVLVNNAGFTVYDKFCEADLQKYLELLQVNINSLIHLTKLFLNEMLENKWGKILNVGSMVSFVPTPWQSTYGASKACVLSFSEALAYELKGTGVTVTCLCPGATATLFYERGNMLRSKATKMKMMDATKVAEVGYEAMKKGKLVAIPGTQLKVYKAFMKLMPRSIVTKMSGSMLEPA
jgi:short-subunit dehydrogenase